MHQPRLHVPALRPAPGPAPNTPKALPELQRDRVDGHTIGYQRESSMTDGSEREAAHLRADTSKWESADLPLFVTPVREMARRGDPDTSKTAAVAISDRLSRLQREVLAAYRQHGAMSARQVENLPEFEFFAPSTIRKRVSELHGRDQLRDTGKVDRGCAIYELRPSRATRSASGLARPC